MEYLLHLLILVGIYIMLSQSLNLSAGFGGMISLAHAGFYGVGAYTAALLAVNFQMPFLLALPVAMLLSGLLALVVSAIALRTIDDYFIICTLGIQVVVFSVMNNWMSLTRGPLGIPGIPGISIFGMTVVNKWALLLLTLFFVALIFFFLKKLTRSSFGRTLRALSEDEGGVHHRRHEESVGKRPCRRFPCPAARSPAFRRYAQRHRRQFEADYLLQHPDFHDVPVRQRVYERKEFCFATTRLADKN